MSQGDELKLQRCRLRIRNESRETRGDRIVIMHLGGMAVVQENPQSFSTVHSFEQGQVIPHSDLPRSCAASRLSNGASVGFTRSAFGHASHDVSPRGGCCREIER
jgi:hypothetical protein